jgi:hypothetical protein
MNMTENAIKTTPDGAENTKQEKSFTTQTQNSPLKCKEFHHPKITRKIK